MKTITTQTSNAKLDATLTHTTIAPTQFATSHADHIERTHSQHMGFALLAQTWRDLQEIHYTFDDDGLHDYVKELSTQFALGLTQAMPTPDDVQERLVEDTHYATNEVWAELAPPKANTPEPKAVEPYVPHVAPADWRESMLTITWEDIDALTHDEQTEVLAARGYSDQGTATDENLLASVNYWLRLLLGMKNSTTPHSLHAVARQFFIHENEKAESERKAKKAKPTTKAKAKK